ncbi:MAG: hypothetical protein KF690_07285 [Bacteroidetes bacterium]|nr:hypothetical protein [Bacteroidota bacterium]
MRFFLTAGLFLGSCFLENLLAQPVPIIRDNGQFWRARTLSRIDLLNKQNHVLLHGLPEDIYVRADRPEKHQQGVSFALLRSYKENRMTGFDPVNLEKNLTYAQFMDQLSTIVDVPYGLVPGADADASGPEELPEEIEPLDPDEWSAWEEDFSAGSEDAAPAAPKVDWQHPLVERYLWLGFNVVIEVLGDFGFDSHLSTAYYTPLFVRLVFIYDGEPAIDRPMVAFRYEDVEHIFKNIFVYSPHNDAVTINGHHFVKMQLFESIDINSQGFSAQNLLQAEKQRTRVILFEHNLWCY